MSLSIGDKITLVIPRANSTIIGIVPTIKDLKFHQYLILGCSSMIKI